MKPQQQRSYSRFGRTLVGTDSSTSSGSNSSNNTPARHQRAPDSSSRRAARARWLQEHQQALKSDRTQESNRVPPPPPPSHLRVEACNNWLKNYLNANLAHRSLRREFYFVIKKYVPKGGTTNAYLNNYCLNRYCDILCLDETRVKLRHGRTDYIHANYVRINDDLLYILAQAPLFCTIDHFWYMVFDEQAKVVVQLCPFIEGAKEQCAEYYPMDGNEWTPYALHLEVRVLERKAFEAKKTIISKMQIRCDGLIHEITHIMYYAWPDHRVPESPNDVLEIRNLVHEKHEKKPIIVHSTAGIGRCGVFAAVELVAQRLLVEHNTELNMVELICELRNQRLHAVQNDLQYLAIFRIVMELLKTENLLKMTPELTQFLNEYNSLVERKNRSREKRLRERELAAASSAMP